MRLRVFVQPDTSPDPLGIPGTERLLTLTDGVVAIALTLLVLQFKVPALAPGTDPNSPHALYVALRLSGSLISIIRAPIDGGHRRQRTLKRPVSRTRHHPAVDRLIRGLLAGV